MARVTGIGGVFFKAKDPEKLTAWYRDHLGLALEEWGGAVLKWPEDTAEDKGATVVSFAKADTKWFEPSQASFMINYRVDDMDGIVAQLARAGIELQKGPEKHENGRFAWVMDPEGNKVELWEPKLWDDKNKL
jgi:catechol 2,3-dioxygenase-like lactoylglutathione lyase family enzyme